MQIQEVGQSGEMRNLAALIKSAVGIFYEYVVFFTLLFSFFIHMPLIRNYGSMIALKHVYLSSVALVYMNLSVEPRHLLLEDEIYSPRHHGNTAKDLSENKSSTSRNL